MSYSNVPNRLTHLGGVPVDLASDLHLGNVWFVSSTLGNGAQASGKTPAEAVATLDGALGKASAGDRIYLMEGHAETITGAGGITLDVAGVSVIGLGRYDRRPAFLMDGATTVTMLVTSANCGMENVVFRAGHADIAVFATITAKGMHFNRCHWEENVATENWVMGISAGAADNDYDGLAITGCTYHGVDTAATGCIILNKNANDVRIQGNFIMGDFGNTTFAPIYSPSTEVQKAILVSDNIVHNLHNADAAVGISIANTASTGAIVRNLIGHQDAAGETPVLAGAAGLFCAENYCSGVLGTASGYLYPAVDS